jgi:hypothetical protein
MTPSLINFLVTENGGQGVVCEALECSQPELSQVINGHRVNEPLREKLASFIGVPKERLFDAEFEAVVAYKRSVA